MLLFCSPFISTHDYVNVEDKVRKESQITPKKIPKKGDNLAE
jgi:hypothetical protein